LCYRRQYFIVVSNICNECVLYAEAYMNMYNYKSSAVAEMGDRLAT